MSYTPLITNLPRKLTSHELLQPYMENVAGCDIDLFQKKRVPSTDTQLKWSVTTKSNSMSMAKRATLVNGNWDTFGAPSQR